jgi:hypothetical protein
LPEFALAAEPKTMRDRDGWARRSPAPAVTGALTLDAERDLGGAGA